MLQHSKQAGIAHAEELVALHRSLMPYFHYPHLEESALYYQ